MDGIPVGVEVFGRRRDRYALGSDERDIIYEKEKIPMEWRDRVIIPIYKEKLWGHTGLWKLPGSIADDTYYEDLGKDH